MAVEHPICNERSLCFAMRPRENEVFCTILTESYPCGTCPFKKPKRNITKGKDYGRQPKNYKRRLRK